MGLGWEEVMAKDKGGCECYALPTVESKGKISFRRNLQKFLVTEKEITLLSFEPNGE